MSSPSILDDAELAEKALLALLSNKSETLFPHGQEGVSKELLTKWGTMILEVQRP